MNTPIANKASIGILTAFTLFSCGSQHQAKVNKAALTATSQFSQVQSFLAQEPNLRKWDTPVVADLDQDGYMDLLLNDHGFSVKIIWNNAGKFAAPYDLIMGDMHGVSVDDFNKDGLMDVILARGGGSGSNARNSVIYTIDKNRQITQFPDFDEPLAFMRGRTVKFVDLDKDGNSDLVNFAFPSQEKQGESENYLYKNQFNAKDNKSELVLSGSLPRSFQDGQKVLLTDFNQDGLTDILMYGFKQVKLYKNNGDFAFSEVTSANFPNTIDNVTSVLEIDHDNDGDMDLFFTRGKEFEAGSTFYNPETKVMGFFTKRGPFQFELNGVGDILTLENIQSQWPNKNVYIGESGYEYEFPGETHSGRDIRLVNSDALGFVQKIEKKGTFIGYVGNQNWRIAGDIWSPFTGIVHNVPAYQSTPTEVGLRDVLLENQAGIFVDISDSSGLDLPIHSMSASLGDFNNDGRDDLIVTPRGTMVVANEALIFINSAKGFKALKNHGVVSQELGAIGLSVETLDYNNDGKLDVIVGNDRGKWHLFENLAVESASISVKVQTSPTQHASPLGAKIVVDNCGLKQTRVVGSNGAAYSTSGDTKLHFGRSNCQQVANISVEWANGETQNVLAKTGENSIVVGVPQKTSN